MATSQVTNKDNTSAQKRDAEPSSNPGGVSCLGGVTSMLARICGSRG